MEQSARSSAFAGLASAVIYMVIALLTGADFDGALIGTAGVIGLIIFVVSLVVSRWRTSQRSHRPPS